MLKQLPDKPNIEHLKNQAKALLKAQRNKDLSACDLLRLLPRFSQSSSPNILTSSLSLHECHYAIALSYGYSSWPALRAFLLTHTLNNQEVITMSIIDNTSLSETLDAFNELAFYGRILAPAQAKEVAHWISSHEGKPRRYSGLPSATPLDYERGARLFTGERVTTGAGTGHVLGEEASRALILLGIQDKVVQEALDSATSSIAHFGHPELGSGYYCCATCTVSFWRHLSVSPIEDAEDRIVSGMRVLAARHDDDGKWRSFPFYYTLLALNDIPVDLAQAELHYVAPTCERLLKRARAGDRYATRRRDLLEQVLERC